MEWGSSSCARVNVDGVEREDDSEKGLEESRSKGLKKVVMGG